MLLVTHQLGFARRAADQVLFMDQGRIVEMGSAAAVIGAPQKERTRAFIAAASLAEVVEAPRVPGAAGFPEPAPLE